MTNNPDFRPATVTEIFRIPPIDPSTASAASRRVEPIHEPIEAIGKRWTQSGFHKAERTLTKFRGEDEV